MANEKEEKNKESKHIDWFLATLVDMVNTGRIQLGITLNIGGILVSGDLASGRDFFDDFAEKFASGMEKFGSDTAKSVETTIKNFAANIYPQSDEETTDNDKTKIRKVEYIHLKDAKFFHPNGTPIPTNDGISWRGRLETVDGFSFGKLSAT